VVGFRFPVVAFAEKQHHIIFGSFTVLCNLFAAAGVLFTKVKTPAPYRALTAPDNEDQPVEDLWSSIEVGCRRTS
jgi:hypothetical protein